MSNLAQRQRAPSPAAKSNRHASEARYKVVPDEKAEGATYTPKLLADFVAERVVNAFAPQLSGNRPLRILDPAVGDGELFISILRALEGRCSRPIELHGFEPNKTALDRAIARIQDHSADVTIEISSGNFLEFVLDNFGSGFGTLFNSGESDPYHLVIANPPYVRTQIMGAEQAQLLAMQFGLAGRVDLYYAFLLGMARVLDSTGVAGIIVSNRFMTTRSGASVRRALLREFAVEHVWDLGDTKLFDAAVLPAVILARKQSSQIETPGFTSIYECQERAKFVEITAIHALRHEGVVGVNDGRRFRVKHGQLDTSGSVDGVWRVATQATDEWLSTVQAHSWGTFRTIGKARVGVKTCGDNVFIRADWDEMPEEQRPENLRQIITHHIGGRFRANTADCSKKILYPHESVQGRRRAIDLSEYPRARAYLEKHRAQLASRTYVIEGGREWYEIWVPQDPASWALPKLVFRDISERPTFWIDLDGSIVNGDCYWIAAATPETETLLWLACAVANSTFIEHFYDHRFNNKLYAGRRRFMTQYVEEFPLPDPTNELAHRIVTIAQTIFLCACEKDAVALELEADELVWKAFGLTGEKIIG